MVKSAGKHEVSTGLGADKQAGRGTGRKGKVGGRKSGKGLSKPEVKKRQQAVGLGRRKRANARAGHA